MRRLSGILITILILLVALPVSRTVRGQSSGTRAATGQVPANKRVLMTYFASWTDLSPTDIPASKITHVLYAFSDLNAKGQ